MERKAVTTQTLNNITQTSVTPFYDHRPSAYEGYQNVETKGHHGLEQLFSSPTNLIS